LDDRNEVLLRSAVKTSVAGIVLLFRPTQKLASRLGWKLPAVTPPTRNWVTDWCVQDFSAGRIRYLLFANTASLYPVIVRARGVNTLESLVRAFEIGVRQTLKGTAGEGHLERWILPELSKVELGRIPGRSLLGSTNDFIRMAYFDLHEDGVSVEDTSRRLAQVPMTYLGFKSPDRVFPALKGAEYSAGLDQGPK
jgi:hypothetical protein